MEEGNERNGNLEKPKKYEFFSKSVRAGRRTYYFDVRATQGNDFYLTITESKKLVDPGGHVTYERHKMFLYPEDFDIFSDGLAQVIRFVRNTNFKDATIIKRNQFGNVHQMEEMEKDYNKLEISEPVTTNYSDPDIEFDNSEPKN